MTFRTPTQMMSSPPFIRIDGNLRVRLRVRAYLAEHAGDTHGKFVGIPKYIRVMMQLFSGGFLIAGRDGNAD